MPKIDVVPSPTQTHRKLHFHTVLLAACVLYLTTSLFYSFRSDDFRARGATIAPHCNHLASISAQEFEARRDALARILVELGASAYVAEPSASFKYYANVSTSDWSLSERPLLLIITPEQVEQDVKAKVSILTPAFEAERAHGLPIASEDVSFIQWAEEANPYEHALSILPDSAGPVFVDGYTRTFIVDGLRAVHPSNDVYTAPYKVRRLRERKSKTEIELMKCVNEATVLAIRAVRKQLFLGIRESTASAMMRGTLTAAGLQGGGCLTLFGENAALPHGAGTDRTLGQGDFALFDCGASLHGYKSDVTRTVAISASRIPQEHLDLWYNVREAQTAAIQTARAGVVAKEVDIAARAALNNTKFFTHRLGHGTLHCSSHSFLLTAKRAGIGLETHEDPYLNGGSLSVLETGHAFSDEPGYYDVGKVGVRLEDCFYIEEDGSAVFLTAGVGGQAESPWSP
ncbi:Peptidase-M24 domain-containing protein [Mycena kentingensis (nom. inval.)]|nr:Peptidase-M24 domain-containing protein [Mycena kentingensis (nom. inval.)]